MGALLHPRSRPLISPTHKGPVVNLVGWVVLVTSALAVLTVLVSKLLVVHKLGHIDAILTCALLFAIGYTGAVSSQVTNGLGSPVTSISHANYVAFQKAGYSSFFLYIMAINTAKLTTIYLLYTLTPQRCHRRPIVAVGGFILVWTVGTIFGLAFQCSLPSPYLYTSSTSCISQTSFWYATGVIDILTDAALMVLPGMVIAKLQVSLQKKLTICFAFIFRLASIACTIFRMVEIRPALHRSHYYDPTFDNWRFTLATELEIFCAIFASAIPRLRPFMESIQGGYLTGVIGDSAEPRTGYGSQGASDSYAMRRVSPHNSKLRDGDNHGLGTKNSVVSYARGGAAARRGSQSTEVPRQETRNEKAGHGLIPRAISPGDYHDHSGAGRSDSRMSEGALSGASQGSNAMIIKTTQEWSVQYQEK